MKTIKDVAKKAGVGVSTVSRFLNKKGYVSETSGKKITAAMDELNYYPNAAARSIKNKKSNTVALLIPSISNAFFPELAENIENRLAEYGYKMILCNVNDDRQKEEKYIDMIISNQIDGVISSTGYISQRLLDSEVPIVSTDRIDVKNTQVVCVTSDHYGGTIKAVEHLIDGNCKRLLHLHGDLNVETALIRNNAFIDTCIKEGIYYETRDVKSDFDIEYIKSFDGVFLWNDIVAIRFMRKCLENNIRIPEDIQVMGFDNIALSKLIFPQLSTISQSISGLGQTAADVLIKIIESDESDFENIILETSLKKRSTTLGGQKMKIVVIGSINIDMVTQSIKFPKTGETIIGDSFTTLHGGKGANQAICASRLGAEVDFIGCVGNDSNGIMSIDNFNNNKVNTRYIKKVSGTSTGVAMITVAEQDNSIIIVQGANGKVSKEIIDDYMHVIENAELVLLQLEIPIETVEYIVNVCFEKGIKTVLNPAPAHKLSKEVIEKVTYLTPNEMECSELFEEDYISTMKKYPNKLIVTKGANGVDFFDGDEVVNIPAYKVDVVDTTGAGDSFNGALSVGLVNGMNLKEAIEYGNKVASKTVQKLGAQTAMPYKEDVE